MLDWMGKLKNKIKGAILGGMMGLRRAELEMTSGQINTSESSTGLEQQQESENLGEALMKGEVTQAVEELRYRTYKVDEEAKKLDYRKKNGGKDKKVDVPVITQENTRIVENVLDTLNSMSIKDEWSINIGYRNQCRFKVERFLKNVTIDKRAKKITFSFSSIPDSNEVSGGAFKNALKRMSDIKSVDAASRNDILANISSVSFVTYKCVGMEDFYKVEVSGIHFDENIFMFKDDGFVIKFTMAYNTYSQKDTMSHFKSATMESKYANHEKKNLTVSFSGKEPFVCEECGAIVDDYTASIIQYETGKILCQDCYAKMKGIDINSIKESSLILNGEETTIVNL